MVQPTHALHLGGLPCPPGRITWEDVGGRPEKQNENSESTNDASTNKKNIIDWARAAIYYGAYRSLRKEEIMTGLNENKKAITMCALSGMRSTTGRPKGSRFRIPARSAPSVVDANKVLRLKQDDDAPNAAPNIELVPLNAVPNNELVPPDKEEVDGFGFGTELDNP